MLVTDDDADGDEHSRKLENPLGAVQGLIYVNPEGPVGNPDPIAAAYDIGDTFARMAMDNEETVALIGGGHTFGKTHGAPPGDPCLARARGGRSRGQGLVLELEEQLRQRQGWRHDHQRPRSDLDHHADPAEISRRFMESPDQFADAFARACFKLTHRDMGPRARYLGPEVMVERWNRVLPDGFFCRYPWSTRRMSSPSRRKCWPRASPRRSSSPRPGRRLPTFRGSDKRGGANGARIRLASQKDWAVNQPEQLAKVLQALESIRSEFNAAQTGGKKRSLADLIVLAGGVGVEKAARDAGREVKVPFAPGRADASQGQTDVPPSCRWNRMRMASATT